MRVPFSSLAMGTYCSSYTSGHRFVFSSDFYLLSNKYKFLFYAIWWSAAKDLGSPVQINFFTTFTQAILYKRKLNTVDLNKLSNSYVLDFFAITVRRFVFMLVLVPTKVTSVT